MFEYLINKMQDAASFFQRLAEMSGITDHNDLRDIVQAGIDSGMLHCSLIGKGQTARLYITNTQIKTTSLSTVGRLIRDVNDEIGQRSQMPSGQIFDMELTETYRTSVDYLSSIKFIPNPLILSVMEELVADGWFDARTDKMELLMLQEFRKFGTDPYNLPLFPDRRWRKYTQSGGVASYQGGDWHRAICDFELWMDVDQSAIDFCLPRLEDEYGVNQDNFIDILADPVSFIKEHKGKKPACSLRAAECIKNMLMHGRSNYIFQQDQTNSGGGIYSFFNGDRNLALLTNFLPSPEPQCLYNAATQHVAAAGQLPTECKNHENSTSRGTGKTMLLPMIYGAANRALTRGLFLAKPKTSSVEFVDEVGSYVEGSFDGVPVDAFNQDHHEFLKGLGWDHAVSVGSDLARAYETALYGSKTVSGLTTRLRPTMVAIKQAAKTAALDSRVLSWTAPNGMKVLNYKLMTDKSEEGRKNMKTIYLTYNGKSHRVSMLPIVAVDNQAAAPPNAIHSVDGSVIDFAACRFKRKDMQAACIHDSIGTHCANARSVFPIMKAVYMEDIDSSWLDNEILIPNGVPSLASRGWLPLDKKEFAKTKHWLG